MAPLSYMNVASNYSKVDHATTSNNYITNDVPTEQQFKNIPEIPPSVKVTKNPSDQRVCVFITRLPPHRVASQLNILAPVGIATAMVVTMKAARQKASIPEVSMWCPQTINPTTPIPAIAKTIDLYPKIDLRALVARTSETIPNAGTITTYTSG